MFQDNVYCHVTSGLGAGLFAVLCGSPVDVVKSRMMGACVCTCLGVAGCMGGVLRGPCAVPALVHSCAATCSSPTEKASHSPPPRRYHLRFPAGAAPGVYSGVLDCFAKTFKADGPLAFYSGFTSNFARLGAWNSAMFVLLEQARAVMRDL